MIYKFTSKATGDHLMEDAVGARLLGIIGKAATAQGIIEVASMAAAIKALSAAVAEDESRLAQGPGDRRRDDADASELDTVTLRQHVWPFVEMLKLAEAAGEVIVWGG